MKSEQSNQTIAKNEQLLMAIFEKAKDANNPIEKPSTPEEAFEMLENIAPILK